MGRVAGKNRREKAKPSLPVESEPSDGAVLAALLLIVTVYALLRVNLIAIPLDRDEGAFGFAGRVILDGGLPYRDVLDHKPPVVFYLYALALWLFKPNETGIHYFLHLTNFLTLLALTALMKAFFHSWRPALWGALVFAIFSASPGIEGFVASTEMLMLLPIVVCLWCAVLAVEKRSLSFLFVSGVVGALAFWTKPTALTSVLFAPAWFVARSVAGRKGGEARGVGWAASLSVWLAGAGAASLAIAGYFYQKGIFGEFVYWSFTHNVAYALRASADDSRRMLAVVTARLFRGDFLFLVIGPAVAIWRASQRRSESFFVLGFFGLSVAGVLPGYVYPHYFAQLAPAVAIASGWGISELLFRIRQEKQLAALAVAALLVGIPVIVNRDYFLESSPARISRDYYGRNPFAESKELAEYVASKTQAEDRLFIFGSEPQILLYAQRRSATAFPMIYPLTSSYPRCREFQERLWREIQQSRPKYVLFVNIPTSILWDGKADLEVLRRVDAWISRDYAVEAVMTVGEKGRLIPAEEGKAPPDEVIRSKTNIYVYRAKGG